MRGALQCVPERVRGAARPLLGQLYDAGQLTSELFALQFCRGPAPDGSARFGVLALGGVPASRVAGGPGALAWLPVRKTLGEYYGYFLITLAGVSGLPAFAADDFDQGYGGALLDSGTTELLLPAAVVGDPRAEGTLLHRLFSEYDGEMDASSLETWLRGEASASSRLLGLPPIRLFLGGDDGADAAAARAPARRPRFELALEWPRHSVREGDDSSSSGAPGHAEHHRQRRDGGLTSLRTSPAPRRPRERHGLRRAAPATRRRPRRGARAARARAAAGGARGGRGSRAPAPLALMLALGALMGGRVGAAVAPPAPVAARGGRRRGRAVGGRRGRRRRVVLGGARLASPSRARALGDLIDADATDEEPGVLQAAPGRPAIRARRPGIAPSRGRSR